MPTPSPRGIKSLPGPRIYCTLYLKPGLRYNKTEPKLIEPDVAFVKHGDEYLVLMNDEDLPQLRASPTYRKMLNQNGGVEKDVKDIREGTL